MLIDHTLNLEIANLKKPVKTGNRRIMPELFEDKNLYNNWTQIAEWIVQTNQTEWKSNPHVHSILEHVSYHLATAYAKGITFSSDLVQYLVAINDKYGGSRVEQFNTIQSSCSSLRYVKHAEDICNYLKSKKLGTSRPVVIVEVGGGYGGLAVILYQVAKLMKLDIQNHIIYDLPSIQNLQKYYLQNHPEVLQTMSWNNSNLFGADLEVNPDVDYVLVSNYCISEILLEYREKYLSNLVPKVQAMYMIWNSQSRAFLPSGYNEQDEVPQTGEYNVVITL
jgi:hypothetical protein